MMEPYDDRRHAGRVLAARLGTLRGNQGLLVLGLPRGGVPVAAEIAQALAAPLDIVVVRKVSIHGYPEVAMGALAAVAGTITTVQNPELIAEVERRGGGFADFEDAAARERVELARRERVYRGGRPSLDVSGRIVVVVDDGVATGATMRAAVSALRSLEPERIVVAVPMCLPGALAGLQEVADEVVCPWLPERFFSVGQAYKRFDQTSDLEVQSILGSAPAGDSRN